MKFLLICLAVACLLSGADSLVSGEKQITAGDATTCATPNNMGIWGWEEERKAGIRCMEACDAKNCTRAPGARSRCLVHKDGRTECVCL
ncbi:hypothetical protein PENTCL1PPCAC_20181, partial [Pristionchus entomophagus]